MGGMAATFTPYSVGLCSASVCTSMSATEAAERLNAERPTGVGPWVLSGAAEFADGTPMPCPCPDDDACVHFLFSC